MDWHFWHDLISSLSMLFVGEPCTEHLVRELRTDEYFPEFVEDFDGMAFFVNISCEVESEADSEEEGGVVISVEEEFTRVAEALFLQLSVLELAGLGLVVVVSLVGC